MKIKKFKTRRGQVDYSKARWAPVINCVLEYKDKILIVQRSKNLNFYPGYWNGISGFLDDHKSLKQKVTEEIREELKISPKNIRQIKIGAIFHQDAPQYKKTWIVHPVLVKVSIDKVNIDWEAKNYKWVKASEARKFKLLPGFSDVLKNFGLF